MRSRRGRTSPFTLFTFQDIITSVTGIMLLLTLLLALELITRKPVSSAAAAITTANDLRHAIAAARLEIDRLQPQAQAGHQHVLELANASTTLLAKDSQDVQLQIDRLNTDLAHARQAAQQSKQQLDRALADSFDRQVDRKHLEELERQIEEIGERIESLLKSSRLIFNPSPGDARGGWLVEVSGSGLWVAPLGRSQPPVLYSGTSQRELRSAFQLLLLQLDPSAEYIVLLVKPSGMDVFFDLVQRATDSRFDLGFDVVGEDQTVFDPETGANFP